MREVSVDFFFSLYAYTHYSKILLNANIPTCVYVCVHMCFCVCVDRYVLVISVPVLNYLILVAVLEKY